MSINPSTGVIPPPVCVSRRLSTKPIILQKPNNGDLSACAIYAHEASQRSAKPFRTLTFIWGHFLKAYYLQANITTAIPVELSHSTTTS